MDGLTTLLIVLVVIFAIGSLTFGILYVIKSPPSDGPNTTTPSEFPTSNQPLVDLKFDLQSTMAIPSLNNVGCRVQYSTNAKSGVVIGLESPTNIYPVAHFFTLENNKLVLGLAPLSLSESEGERYYNSVMGDFSSQVMLLYQTIDDTLVKRTYTMKWLADSKEWALIEGVNKDIERIIAIQEIPTGSINVKALCRCVTSGSTPAKSTLIIEEFNTSTNLWNKVFPASGQPKFPYGNSRGGGFDLAGNFVGIIDKKYVNIKYTGSDLIWTVPESLEAFFVRSYPTADRIFYDIAVSSDGKYFMSTSGRTENKYVNWNTTEFYGIEPELYNYIKGQGNAVESSSLLMSGFSSILEDFTAVSSVLAETTTSGKYIISSVRTGSSFNSFDIDNDYSEIPFTNEIFTSGFYFQPLLIKLNSNTLGFFATSDNECVFYSANI